MLVLEREPFVERLPRTLLARVQRESEECTIDSDAHEDEGCCGSKT